MKPEDSKNVEFVKSHDNKDYYRVLGAKVRVRTNGPKHRVALLDTETRKTIWHIGGELKEFIANDGKLTYFLGYVGSRSSLIYPHTE